MSNTGSRGARPGRLGRLLRGLALALAAYLLAFLLLPPVQTATRTLVLLPELIELPVRPLSALTATPRRETTSYGTPADRLDVYLPADARADRSHPAVVLVLGIHPQPLDSPDVLRIASSIARLGVVVGVPDSTALRATRLEAAEPAHLADAVIALSGRAEVNPARVGLAGFSAGASIALIAAADPRIRGQLRYVSAFGGYADAETLLVDVATSTAVLDDGVLAWQPDEGITRDVRGLFLDTSGDPALTDALFSAPTRDAAAAILEHSPPSLRAQLALVSPLTFGAQVGTRVYILHGEADTAIPFSHALVLAEALGERVVKFTSFGRFGHGQPGQGGLGLDDLPDVWALALYLHEIVAVATEWP